MNTGTGTLSLTLPELINIITTINLIIIFVLLFIRRHNTLPNRILAIILFLPSLNFVNNYLILSQQIFSFPSIIFISQAGAIAGIPLIYEYLRILMGKKMNLAIILHLISVLLILVCMYYYIDFLQSDSVTKNKVVQDIIDEHGPDYLKYIRGGFFILLNAYFLVLAFQVNQYRRKIMEIRSEIEQLKIGYLQQFVIMLWALNITILLLYICIDNYYVDFMAVPLVITLFYMFLLWTAFNHTAVFTQEGFTSFKKTIADSAQVEITRSGIREFSSEEIDTIRKKLEFLMNEKKIYTDSNLNIVKLSEMLDLNIHQTSFFINKYLKSNFFNFINSKRIELAKKKMKMRGSRSEIENIGFEVGFNSKSAFYRAFNKYVQQSPKDYIREIGTGS